MISLWAMKWQPCKERKNNTGEAWYTQPGFKYWRSLVSNTLVWELEMSCKPVVGCWRSLASNNSIAFLKSKLQRTWISHTCAHMWRALIWNRSPENMRGEDIHLPNYPYLFENVLVHILDWNIAKVAFAVSASLGWPVIVAETLQAPGLETHSL